MLEENENMSVNEEDPEQTGQCLSLMTDEEHSDHTPSADLKHYLTHKEKMTLLYSFDLFYLYSKQK